MPCHGRHVALAQLRALPRREPAPRDPLQFAPEPRFRRRNVVVRVPVLGDSVLQSRKSAWEAHIQTGNWSDAERRLYVSRNKAPVFILGAQKGAYRHHDHATELLQRARPRSGTIWRGTGACGPGISWRLAPARPPCARSRSSS